MVASGPSGGAAQSPLVRSRDESREEFLGAKRVRDTMITLHEHVMPAGRAQKNAAGERCADARGYNPRFSTNRPR